MSILIKGMEMPTSCGECKAFVCYRQWAGDVGDCFCGITKNDAKAKEKNADCPLVPVPKHGRLIDGDKLAEEQKENVRAYHANLITLDDLAECLLKQSISEDGAPTIIPAEQAEEGE